MKPGPYTQGFIDPKYSPASARPTTAGQSAAMTALIGALLGGGVATIGTAALKKKPKSSDYLRNALLGAGIGAGAGGVYGHLS